MSDSPTHVKIYDRPEPKRPAAWQIVVALLVLLAVGYFLYRAFVHPAVPPQRTSNAVIHSMLATRQNIFSTVFSIGSIELQG